MSTANQYPDFTGMTFEKVWASIQESRREFQESRREFQESRREFQEEMRLSHEKAEKEMKELREQMKETDRQIKKTEQMIGRLGNRFGEVIEHYVRPGVIPRFNELGYHFDSQTNGFKILDHETGKTLSELDIVLENGESVIVVEIKVDPSVSDVRHHIKRLHYYREFRNRSMPNDTKKIYGTIAAAVFPEKVQAAALEAGFYVIVQSGKTIKIDVPEGFVPRAF